MKIYTIGRDPACKFSFSDDMISRHHALLRVYANGKMEIVDTSSNGTYINNMRIASNVPVPVTRKDNISFAGARQFDWTQVPSPMNLYIKIAIGIIAALLLIGGIVVGVNACSGSDRIESVSGGYGGGGGSATDNESSKGSGKASDASADSKTKNPDWVARELEKARQAKAKKAAKNKSTKPAASASNGSNATPENQQPTQEKKDNNKKKEVF